MGWDCIRIIIEKLIVGSIVILVQEILMTDRNYIVLVQVVTSKAMDIVNGV